MSRFQFVFAPLIALGLLLSLAPMAALASARNGELCAVQSYDGQVVLSQHRFPFGAAQYASRQQLAEAGGWCTNQIAIRGWMPADKFYDGYTTQSDVCIISSPYWTTYSAVSADASSWSGGVQACYDLRGDNPSATITWY